MSNINKITLAKLRKFFEIKNKSVRKNQDKCFLTIRNYDWSYKKYPKAMPVGNCLYIKV